METDTSLEAQGIAPLIEEATAAANELTSAMAPAGPFTAPAIRDAVNALSQCLQHFGPASKDMITALKDLKAEDSEELPDAIAQAIDPVMSAINDAVAEDVLDAEMSINLDGLSGDAALREIATRARMAAGSRDFRKFLKEEVKEEEEGAAEMEGAEVEADDAEALFMARL